MSPPAQANRPTPITSHAIRSLRTAMPRTKHISPAQTLTPQKTQSWKKSSRSGDASPSATCAVYASTLRPVSAPTATSPALSLGETSN